MYIKKLNISTHILSKSYTEQNLFYNSNEVDSTLFGGRLLNKTYFFSAVGSKAEKLCTKSQNRCVKANVNKRDNNYTDKDKVVSIAGGGDSALDWAVILASISSKVNLIHRRAKFRGHDATVEKVHKLAEEGKINLVIPYHLEDLEGEDGYIKNIVLKDLDDQKIKLPSDYLLAFFGLKSDIGHLNDFGFEIQNHHIIVDECFYQTSVEGIYAAGDISSYKGKIKLILTGFAESASALHHAYKKVFDKELHFQYSTSKGIPK
jgi:thioredoxin reductase (NADPH)